MHDLAKILKYQKKYCQELIIRGFSRPLVMFERIVKLKTQRTCLNNNLEKISAIITDYKKQINTSHTTLRNFYQQKKSTIAKIKIVHQLINDILLTIPNVSHNDKYLILSNTKNKVLKIQTKFKIQNNSFDYVQISKKFKLINFENSSANYGSNSAIYVNQGAELIRGLINYCLAFNRQKKYLEIIVPTIIKNSNGIKTGKIPKFEKELFFIHESKNQDTKLSFLSPTAEVQLMMYYQNQILLPKNAYKLTSYTNCFRREAGAAGTKTRGNLRLHEFHKVEIVTLTKKSSKINYFLEMKSEIAELLESLELNYRIVEIAKKNLSFSTLMTNDFEIYFSGSKKYIEVSSLSDCGDFQTKRLNIRYLEEKTQKKCFFNSFNGSALAIDRLFSALIEQNYDNNKILIPKALQKYVSFTEIKF